MSSSSSSCPVLFVLSFCSNALMQCDAGLKLVNNKLEEVQLFLVSFQSFVHFDVLLCFYASVLLALDAMQCNVTQTQVSLKPVQKKESSNHHRSIDMNKQSRNKVL